MFWPIDHDFQFDPAIASPLSDAIAGERIRAIVVAPRLRLLAERTGWRRWLTRLRPWRWSPARTLVLTSTRLLVVEQSGPDAAPALCSIPLARLLSIEVAVVLLHGWMTCTWAEDGSVAQVTVKFNSVSDSLFWEIQRTICTDLAAKADLALNADLAAEAMVPSSQPSPAVAPTHRDPLARLPYKFRNLIPLRLLLPGERIEAVAFQPGIWKRHLLLFRRRIRPTTLLLLSNLHLLLISEEEVDGDANSHGLVTRYYPRSRLADITVTQNRTATANVTIETRWQTVVHVDTVDIEQANTAAVQSLIDHWFDRREG